MVFKKDTHEEKFNAQKNFHNTMVADTLQSALIEYIFFAFFLHLWLTFCSLYGTYSMLHKFPLQDPNEFVGYTIKSKYVYDGNIWLFKKI